MFTSRVWLPGKIISRAICIAFLLTLLSLNTSNSYGNESKTRSDTQSQLDAQLLARRIRDAYESHDVALASSLVMAADKVTLNSAGLGELLMSLLSLRDDELRKDVLVRLRDIDTKPRGVIDACIRLSQSPDPALQRYAAAVAQHFKVSESECRSTLDWIKRTSDTDVLLSLVAALADHPDLLAKALLEKPDAGIVLDNRRRVLNTSIHSLLSDEATNAELREALTATHALPASCCLRLWKTDRAAELERRAQTADPFQQDFYHRCIAGLVPTARIVDSPSNGLAFSREGQWDYWTVGDRRGKTVQDYREGIFPTVLVGRVSRRGAGYPAELKLRFARRTNNESDRRRFSYNVETGLFYVFCTLPARYPTDEFWKAVGAESDWPVATGVIRVAISTEGEEKFLDLGMYKIRSEIEVP